MEDNNYKSFLSVLFARLALFEIKINLKKLSEELIELVKYYDNHKDELNKKIDNRIKDLNALFSDEIKFQLDYCYSIRSCNLFKFNGLNKYVYFKYDKDNYKCVSEESLTLNTYFRDRLKYQAKAAKEIVEVLGHMDKQIVMINKNNYIIKPAFCMLAVLIVLSLDISKNQVLLSFFPHQFAKCMSNILNDTIIFLSIYVAISIGINLYFYNMINVASSESESVPTKLNIDLQEQKITQNKMYNNCINTLVVC